MGMCVDQSWHQYLAAAIDGFCRGIFFFEFVLRSHGDDTIAQNRECAGIELLHFFVHREDVCV